MQYNTQLDLGCGNTLRRYDNYVCYGVDIVDSIEPLVRKADLAIDKIPFDDNFFNDVTAYDFIEHIPPVVYVNGVKRNCVIELFNEIYRVLKNNGIFTMESPCYPHLSSFQDPTHVFIITTETINYFSGDYYGFHDHYGHTSHFEKLDMLNENGRIKWKLQAKK